MKKVGLFLLAVPVAVMMSACTDPPMIKTTDVPPGTAGIPYDFRFEVSDGYHGDRMHWVLESGPLPSGLALEHASGRLHGTPTAEGTYPLEVCCNQVDLFHVVQAKDCREFALVINAAP